jgi:hypothetical protein
MGTYPHHFSKTQGWESRLDFEGISPEPGVVIVLAWTSSSDTAVNGSEGVFRLTEYFQLVAFAFLDALCV